MSEPEWIEYDVVLAIQEAQIAEHGGPTGVRDQALLESALARPRNLFAYSPGAPLYQLAAAYAFGIARNHAFVDGNKRVAWIVCALFLELNGVEVVVEQTEVVQMVVQLAAGQISEQQFARWLEMPSGDPT